MGANNPGLTAFNAGELSPLMEGRVDFAKYASGCQELSNFVPTVQGPVRRRQGTRFVHEVKQSANRTWLARFEFNVTQSFILEFGNLYIRFYTNRGIVESSPGVPYEIASPYSTGDLQNNDGSFALSMVQSADVIYIAHKSFPPQKLSRFGNTNWTIANVDFKGGPFEDVNKDEAIKVYASAETGSVTLQASANIFAPTDVNSFFYLEQEDSKEFVAWEVNRQFGQTQTCTSDGKFYVATSTFIGPATKQYSGTLRPTHIKGRAFDGSRTNGPVQQETSETIGVEWEYLHSGFGWVQITAFIDANTVTATVISRLPLGVVDVTRQTSKWAHADWSNTNGYPSHVTFFRERLTFAGKQKLWFSVTGDFENFTPKASNVVVDDDSINVTISSDQVNDVTWLVSANALLIGTSGGEFVCSENSSSDPFATRNIKITQQNRFGGRSVAPQVVSSQTLFVQKAGRKLREIAYSFERDAYASNDLTVLSEHITKGGIIQMVYQQEPDTIVWSCTGDGKLLGFTYNLEQDVLAWHRHSISGDFVGGGAVESIQVIPTPDGTSEDLWMIVRRTINGVTERYVEYMTPNWSASDGMQNAVFLDSSLEYVGPLTATLSGLGHLEGATVGVMIGGATHPDRVVTGGAIQLQYPVARAQVGLRYTSKLTTMRIEAGATQGTAQAKLKRTGKVFFRFVDTVGGFYGIEGLQLDEIQFRDSSMPMDQAVEPFSGDKEVQWPIGWERDGRLTIEQIQPLPMTLLAIYPEMKTSG